MPARALPRPAALLRTATAKRARTRQRVLRAARECVAEKGAAGATAAEIARRCDLSWGVIQYHFGDSVGLLLALLESGLESLGDAFAEVHAADRPPAERVRALVDGTWSLMSRKDYRVMLEVQLQLGRDATHRARVRKQTRRMRAQLQELWRKALPECSPLRVATAERLATIALRGLALERAVEGGRNAQDADRDALVKSLLDVLALDAG